MEKLDDYLSYTHDASAIRDTLLSLDEQLAAFNKRGYGVEVKPSKIENSNGMFVFSNFHSGLTEEERRQEITDLAKLAVGTYYSLASGQFVDYTKISIEVLRQNYDNWRMDDSILKTTEGDSYYRDVIVEGKNDIYYNDYIVALREAQGRNRTSTKAVVKSLGTLGSPNTVKEEPEIGIPKTELNNKQAAFIDIVFYPILLAVLAMVGYAISIIIKVL